MRFHVLALLDTLCGTEKSNLCTLRICFMASLVIAGGW